MPRTTIMHLLVSVLSPMQHPSILECRQDDKRTTGRVATAAVYWKKGLWLVERFFVGGEEPERQRMDHKIANWHPN